MKQLFKHLFIVALMMALVGGGCATQQPAMRPSAASFVNLDTVKAGQFDTGKMWTFDYPPMDYFARTYSMSPSKEWFEKARLSCLRLPGCSASFITEDGLVMSNHHCARGPLDLVNRPGENLPDDGFYASTLEEERKVPGLNIDQLALIEDVTDEIVKAFESGKTDEERVRNRQEKVAEVEKRYRDKTGLMCNVITFYNGGRYSLYGYKRYTDVRLVFAVETDIGFYGGDPDNFTYPRYDIDLSLFRVYDNGKPLKTQNYFKWSRAGAAEGEPVFVLGNPGRTNRLLTVSQLEFFRDQSYPFTFLVLDNMVKIYSDFIAKYPDKRMKYQTALFGFSNSQKLYEGRLKGLRDPVLIAKKKDFERTFRAAVSARPNLSSQYSGVWTDIEKLQADRTSIYAEQNIYNFGGAGRSVFFTLASNLVDYVNQMKLPEAQRAPRFKGAMLDTTKARFYPAEVDVELQRAILAFHLSWMKQYAGGNNAQLNALLKGQSPAGASNDLISRTILTSKDRVMALLNANPDNIMSSTDPFISFVVNTMDRAKVVRERVAEILSKEAARVQSLGKALYDVYGTSFPPDATFTLRVADGVVKGYPYNGTIAPPVTTFYGMYDRYYSFGKRDPWKLTPRWQNPPPEFNMSTPMNFSSTNDIIGGNSGSPVVNKNLEIVGLVFDGNIESLPNDIIYSDEVDRAVSVHSAGILEALENIYKANRLVKEIRAGKILQ
jgi:hypothetical protein